MNDERFQKLDEIEFKWSNPSSTSKSRMSNSSISNDNNRNDDGGAGTFEVPASTHTEEGNVEDFVPTVGTDEDIINIDTHDAENIVVGNNIHATDV
jgi:hypothetical protein